MHRIVDRVFFEHPAKVDESYGEHFMFAARFGMTLLGAGAAAIAHAFVPCLFERTASTAVKRLHTVIVSRSQPAAGQSQRISDDPLAYI